MTMGTMELSIEIIDNIRLSQSDLDTMSFSYPAQHYKIGHLIITVINPPTGGRAFSSGFPVIIYKIDRKIITHFSFCGNILHFCPLS